MQFKEFNYHGWNAYALNAGDVELVLPTDIGPRIISCSLKGGDNLFCTIPEELGSRGEEQWCLRGGHRLWHSPELKPRTYDLDNFPIQVKPLEAENGAVMVGNPDPVSGMQKSISIEVQAHNSFKLTHRLVNVSNAWAVECAPWALSVMALGGYAVIPLLPRGDHETSLLPNYTLIPWTYTDFSLPVWDFHTDYIGVETSRATGPQKIGISNYLGWSAYWQSAGTFVKYSPVSTQARYPDFNSCFELFSNDMMCELETLGALVSLEQGEAVEHVEYWCVLEGLSKPATNDVFNDELKPAVDAWIKTL